jgi:hypothetical protein
VDGDRVDAGDALYGPAATVDGAPAPAALRPADTAHKAVQLIELRLDHNLPGGVDQSSFVVLEKRDQTALAESADAIGV